MNVGISMGPYGVVVTQASPGEDGGGVHDVLGSIGRSRGSRHGGAPVADGQMVPIAAAGFVTRPR
jgi:hypothetical protein